MAIFNSYVSLPEGSFVAPLMRGSFFLQIPEAKESSAIFGAGLMSKTLGTKIFMIIPYFLNRWAVFKTPVDDGAILANGGCHNRVAQPERFLRISRVTIFRSLHLRNVLKKQNSSLVRIEILTIPDFPLKSESCFLFWSEHLPFIYFFCPLTPPGAREGEVSHVLVREDDGSAGWWTWGVKPHGGYPSIAGWLDGWFPWENPNLFEWMRTGGTMG